MQPRDYQRAALDAIRTHLSTRETNPVVVIPTGGGKSPVMAWTIQEFKAEYPPLRVLCLAHVRELLAQNADKLLRIWPECPLGIYSAGMNSRQLAPVTIAGIQSVYRRAEEIGHIDLVLVDEAHRIPLAGDGMYRTLLAGLGAVNPAVRVVGFTATPFRTKGGPICRPDGILHEICHESNVRDLIAAGWLSPLDTRGAAKHTPDISGVRIVNGEFAKDELEQAVNKADLVRSAVADLVPRLEGRKRVIVFAVSIAHAETIAGVLRMEHAEEVVVVSSRTPDEDRDRALSRFRSGEVRIFCNVNIASEGFDVPDIDAVVMMRPTASPGLYAQQVGRGLRIFPGKTECLVLDYAGNVKRHGPIDRVAERVKFQNLTDTKPGAAPVKECPACGRFVALGTAHCECGHDWPAREVDHERRPYMGDVVSSGKPVRHRVTALRWRRHEKPDRPDSVCITWECEDCPPVREWLCFDHGGFAAVKAGRWWRAVVGEGPVPTSTDHALDLLDSGAGAFVGAVIEAIFVNESGKYPEVRRHDRVK